jgi:hypothetical protein
MVSMGAAKKGKNVNARTGIAFIRGIGMYGKKNYTKIQIFDALKKAETDSIFFIGMYGNDNVVFKILNRGKAINTEKNEKCTTANVHMYATAGTLIEKTLRKKFGGRFYVTTRSFGTVDRVIKKFRMQKETKVLH